MCGKDADVNKIQDQRSGRLPSEGVPLRCPTYCRANALYYIFLPQEKPQNKQVRYKNSVMSARFDKRGRYLPLA
eukprot:scaffold9370_cov152-Skeletonema_marinoi.AAC.2